MKHNIIITKPKMNGQAMIITVDGKTYPSLNQLRFSIRISETEIRKYRKETNCSLEEAIDYLICKLEKKQEERKNRILREREKMKKYAESHEFVYKNVTYKSFSSAIRSLNSNGHTMSASYISTLAKKENITKQEAIDLYLERRKLYLEKEKIKYSYLLKEYKNV